MPHKRSSARHVPDVQGEHVARKKLLCDLTRASDQEGARSCLTGVQASNVSNKNL